MNIHVAIRKRPKIGDVIEIKTPKGLAYAQFTHKHDAPPKYGALLRVFRRLYKIRPSDFREMIESEPQFLTFFPLGSACNKSIVEIVSNEDVPLEARLFPTFRAGAANQQGQVETWWLWDGEKEWKVGKLKPGMEKLPIRGVWNDTLLIQRIVEGWSHENVT